MSETKTLVNGQFYMVTEDNVLPILRKNPFYLLTVGNGIIFWGFWDDENNMKDDAIKRKDSGEKINTPIILSIDFIAYFTNRILMFK